jgi:ketosteroid isomerase-like protein
MPAFVQDIAPGAADAVKVVDAFSAAIKAVKLDEAGKLLDPEVLILESGSSERSRDEYLGEHAIADAAFMQTATQQPRYRQARAEGDVAWVGTESLLETTRDGKPLHLLSTETMVLKRTEQGWRIVHIHWSSRPAPKT